MTLQSNDLARLEAASRILLSPLVAPGPEAWLAEAGRAVRDLIGGSGVVLVAPGGPSGVYSEDVPDVAAACMAYTGTLTEDGYASSDPFVDTWNQLRRRAGYEVFSLDFNQRVMAEAGHEGLDSPIVTDVLAGAGQRDFVGLHKSGPAGDAVVWVLGRERDGFRFGEGTPAVLQALVPSFRSGLDALGRLGAHRAALDAVSEPLAAFGPDGGELHRNAALRDALAADVEGATVERAVARLGRAGTPQARRSDGPLAATDTVQTAQGRYALRRTELPPGLFGADPAVLVTVAVSRAPAPPSAEAVRERTGLTAREAEVALLLAQGLTNAEVADRLFIAPATARRHTESVLGKLGLTSRAAVASALLAVV